VLLGTAWGGRTAYGISGADGGVIWSLDTYDEPESGWIYQIQPLPDVSGDGVEDAVFCCGSDNDSGYLVDGVTGDVIWTMTYSTDALSHCSSIADVNSDGVADAIFAGQDYEHRTFCVSGGDSVTPELLWAFDAGNSIHGMTVVSDVNFSGYQDVVVGTWSANGMVYCLEGSDGDTIWSYPLGSYDYIMRLVQLSDVNSDGISDVAVGSWDNSAVVLSGADGSLVWRSSVGTLNGGDVWAIGRVEDVNGDGVNDVVAGSFDYNVYAFDGASGDTLWTYYTGNRLYYVTGISDVSSNGIPDVAAGTQMLSGNGGRVYILEGGSPTPAQLLIPLDARALPGCIELSWRSPEIMAFNVYRVEVDSEADSRSRRSLATKYEAGALRSEDVISQILAEPDNRPKKLNPSPIWPEGEDCVFLDGSVEEGATYIYSICTIHPDGEINCGHKRISAVPSSVTSFLEVSAFPNPFSDKTTVMLHLSHPSKASVEIFDISGRLVNVLARDTLGPGWHEYSWVPGALSSGIYFVRCSGGAGERVRKVVYTR
jgi:outer membrane protein assembly factor BamB